ncbi:MAG: hypothetical protein S4CHLAM7_00960 [Chlamydiae bacterium]|nr:hypothetical protein [Chlamydiota bacterium]
MTENLISQQIIPVHNTSIAKDQISLQSDDLPGPGVHTIEFKIKDLTSNQSSPLHKDVPRFKFHVSQDCPLHDIPQSTEDLPFTFNHTATFDIATKKVSRLADGKYFSKSLYIGSCNESREQSLSLIIIPLFKVPQSSFEIIHNVIPFPKVLISEDEAENESPYLKDGALTRVTVLIQKTASSTFNIQTKVNTLLPNGDGYALIDENHPFSITK